MESLDFCDFPVDFLKHLYNFAAAPDEWSTMGFEEPAVVPEQLSQEQVLDEFFAGLDSNPAQPTTDPVRTVPHNSFDSLPIVSNEALIEALKPDSALPLPAQVPQIQQPILNFDLFEAPARDSTQPPKLVSIAPSWTQTTQANVEAKLRDAVRDKEAEKKKALELKALREYNRKIRNRESAARSNLARKRRREMQRMELAKKQRMDLAEKQRVLQTGLGSVMS